MKCKYCGYNLGLEDEYCPHCGKANEQAKKHIEDMKHYREDYEQTRDDVITKSTRFNSVTARVAIIAVLLLLIIIMLIITANNSDIETREKRNNKRIAEEVEKNRSEIEATLKEMEEHRDYLAMKYFMTNHRLRSNDDFNEYSRVFTAVIDYEVIYSDIISIVDGFDGYGDKTAKDRCYDIAIYISDWNRYVDGEFWNDSPDSPMHSGEHGAFLRDIRKDTQDMVQVYFELTDDQASSMWTMEKDDIGEMLYEKCMDLYPKDKEDD